jgi:hypothetical protein
MLKVGSHPRGLIDKAPIAACCGEVQRHLPGKVVFLPVWGHLTKRNSKHVKPAVVDGHAVKLECTPTSFFGSHLMPASKARNLSSRVLNRR